MFTQSIIESINYYVYFLRDPRTKEVFYVGKGKGNRVFEHGGDPSVDEFESEKIERIKAITISGDCVERFILRHGLTESAALEIEAALIDYIGIANLSNIQSGHYSSDYGIKTTEELVAMYTDPKLQTEEPVILININKLFNREMTESQMYDATRKSWVVGERRNKAKYAIATYKGLTREVYEIHEWFQIGSRWGFNGERASESIRARLRYKSTVDLAKQGAANPIRYVNC